MEKKEYFDEEMKSAKESQHKKFEEEQLKKYGESEWMDEVYRREKSRLQPIIDAIDNSPSHTVTINGYKCSKDSFGYHLGIDKSLPMVSEMITIRESPEFNEIKYNGAYFIRPLGSITISNDVNNRGFDTIGNSEITQENSRRTILENAGYFHYVDDANIDKEKQIDLQFQLLMLKSLEIPLTDDEEKQILGITIEDLNKQVEEIKQKKNKEREQAESERIRRW